MIKEIFTKILFIGILLSASLVAETIEHSFQSYSLIGVESGYSNIDVGNCTATTDNQKLAFANAGFKIGAQADEYRMFLSVRYYSIDTLEYIFTYGTEFQQKYKLNEVINFFVGVNLGKANLRISDSLGIEREIAEYYYGGDTGFNINLDDYADIELGARMIKINNVSNFNFENFITGYVGIILKYQMD